uniref:Uncharacterized protein n=1 Tax=Tanacetum cinerariifolium TaxID=118510 RepID=A0A6L2P4N2_TANCI|nr:hypothetical protein [Tanacetum cinerariifolium]
MINLKISNHIEFEIYRNFMGELRHKLFKGTDDKDTHELVHRVLEITYLFYFPDVTHDAVMLRVFPVTLKGSVLTWINRLSAGVLDSKGFIPLMTPTQALISIQVMAEHSHNWYDEATTREKINDIPNNVDTKKPKEKIHAIQASFMNYEGAHLTMEYPLKKRTMELSLASNPYRTRESIYAIGIPEEIKEDEGDKNNSCDIMIKDVERLRKILTPPIHALPNHKPIVQPYMPLGLFYNKAKLVKEEE